MSAPTRLSQSSVAQLLHLYLVTDSNACKHHSLLDVVQFAVQAGATCVQLREKELSTGDFVARARALQAILRVHAPHVPLIINDRVDVALAIGADGVHVGQSDMPVELVRQLMPNAIIGLSVESFDDVVQVIDSKCDVDYLGVSPVFATPTKTDTAPPFGLAGLTRVRDMTELPLVSIGGIQLENARQIMQAGSDGIAVVSAICSAENPADATRALLNEINF